jgi:hypothetical protein
MSTPKPAPEEFPLPARPRISSGRLVMGCLGVTLLVLVAAVAVPWLISNRQATAKLNAAVQRVKARGEPLTTAELNDFYQPVKGRPDMTKELMKALAICEAARIQPVAQSLPIIGQGADPPPRGQTWVQLAEVEKYLAGLQEAIGTFHEVARRDGTARFPVDFNPGIATLLPETQKVRDGARALSLQFHVHLHKDEISQANDCILAQFALARSLEREPTLVSQLVQLAIHGVALGNAQALVQQADVSDADLLRLQAFLRKLDLQASLKSGLVGERTISYSACINPQQMAEVMGAPQQGVARQIAERQPKRIFDAAKMLELNLRVTEGADDSIFKARKEALAAEDELRDLAGNLVGKLYYTMTLLLTPAYSSAVTAFARTAAARDSADAAIAAELYRRKHGKWPAKLDELVPEFLPVVPTDPFTNRPLVMKASEASFKVYSLGPDGMDNGGNLTNDQKPGTDMGFEMPQK